VPGLDQDITASRSGTTEKTPGGWKVMPGNGRADDMAGTYADAYQRCVWVFVNSGESH
jgi:hypothetical protein